MPDNQHPDAATSQLQVATPKLDLTETLAERLFYAEMGHTGMTWDQLSPEFGQEDYRRKIGRFMEGLWSPGQPIVVLDLDNDQMWRREAE